MKAERSHTQITQSDDESQFTRVSKLLVIRVSSKK